MDKDKLKPLIRDFLHEISNLSYIKYDSEFGNRYSDLLDNAKKILPDNVRYIDSRIHEFYLYRGYSTMGIPQSNVVICLNYILKLLDVCIPSIYENKKILEDAKDKLKEASLSFENSDYPSVISKLNTGVELALKEELDIPMTIRNINTRKILEICIAHSIGPKDYFPELIKHIVDIDNKTKHQGYNPEKNDAINAMSAFEGFIKRTKKFPFEVTPEIRQKIFSGL
jgi:hypothetical protein